MHWIIDRFEGDCAVCEGENHEMRDVPRKMLPPGAVPGIVLIEGLNGVYRVDIEETNRRRARIKQMQDELWE